MALDQGSEAVNDSGGEWVTGTWADPGPISARGAAQDPCGAYRSGSGPAAAASGLSSSCR